METFIDQRRAFGSIASDPWHLESGRCGECKSTGDLCGADRHHPLCAGIPTGTEPGSVGTGEGKVYEYYICVSDPYRIQFP